MNLSTQRRMAALILKVGEGRVWFDSEELGDIDEAVTRADIRGLINDKVIQARQKKGTSRVRANFRKAQKVKGRRSGHGTRKGAKGARLPKKRKWISTIRPIRKTLVELREAQKIDNPTYRKLYGMSKGGIFKSKAHLNMYVKEKKLIKEEPTTETPKKAKAPAKVKPVKPKAPKPEKKVTKKPVGKAKEKPKKSAPKKPAKKPVKEKK